MKSKQLISDYINLCVHSIPIYEEHFSNQFYIKKQGVYFLFKDNVIVYVGKSINSIQGRLFKHKYSSNKEYDKATYIEVEKEDFDLVKTMEDVYINIFNPFYNKQLKNQEFEYILTPAYKDKRNILNQKLNQVYRK